MIEKRQNYKFYKKKIFYSEKTVKNTFRILMNIVN